MNSYLPQLHLAYAGAYHLGKLGLAVTLFLIGTGISRQTLKEVGARPMIQGVLLWVVVATLSLFAIAKGFIHL
jgi:uncharacterized membrane protein YadS